MVGWGLPDDLFDHRGGMITKSEVRAVVLSKLALPGSGVMWDIGAGSGSVGIESARLRPGLEVFAVERDPDSARRIEANAAKHSVRLTVVEGEASQTLEGLPDPDRVFVGGGGVDVLRTAVDRVEEGGVIVATYALMARAVEAGSILGNMVQISVARAVEVGDHGPRLSAENPVFVCWSR